MRLLTIMAVLALMFAGCAAGCANDSGPRMLPLATNVKTASGHIATSSVLVTGAREDLQKATPLTTQPVRQYVVNADSKLSATQGELQAAQGALSAMRSNVDATNAAMEKMEETNRQLERKLKNSMDDTNHWRNKYENQWLAGKAWRLIYWVVGISVVLLIIDALLPAGINPLYLVWKLLSKVLNRS